MEGGQWVVIVERWPPGHPLHVSRDAAVLVYAPRQDAGVAENGTNMSNETRTLKAHRWSGWPGAFCLDCGCEDPHEIALADGNFIEVPDDSEMGFHFEFPNVRVTGCPA